MSTVPWVSGSPMAKSSASRELLFKEADAQETQTEPSTPESWYLSLSYLLRTRAEIQREMQPRRSRDLAEMGVCGGAGSARGAHEQVEAG